MNHSAPNTIQGDALTDRQQRERAFHSQFAAKHANKINEPPGLDILSPGKRRWWNSYWGLYDFVLSQPLRGKRAFVPGCGFGADACRLAELGAEVHASDISPELIDVARMRADKFGFRSIHFEVTPAEKTNHPDDFFDLALFVGVFHHIDINTGLFELGRIMKPGGLLIAHEVYSHSVFQVIRNSWFIDRILYPPVSRFIYGGVSYITEDEHKLNEHELRLIRHHLTDDRIQYFHLFQGRLFPSGMTRLSRVDQRLIGGLGPLAGFVAGRVVFMGRLRK